LSRPGVALPAGVVLLLILVGCSSDPKPATAGEPAEKKVAAPDLTGGSDWLNTDQPLDLKALKGRVVLLDFWTLCCINCIHTLPDLAKLEAKYPGVLVVIGVHTPKFDNEKNTESIRKAILRYEVKHPVINDAEQKIWRRYRVNSWPTIVLIDPDGNYYGRVGGEGNFEVLDEHIGKLVKDYRARKLLKETPLEFHLAREKETSPLYFPGKVLADAPGNRLFIADSTNHRIVITNRDGKKIAIAGDGHNGFKDGPFADARFSDPQGMALVGNTLYVADRKNHSIRALDLKEQRVWTVAGTGQQIHDFTVARYRGGPALNISLNSPWDLLAHDGKIYIAMAGHHQIWTYDPERERVDPYAGNGRENIADGSLTQSSFAQPSGLATDGKVLYVADSEISAIRAVPLERKGEVTTIVGEGLFEFGDVDGVGSKVRLQHALGVAYHQGKLYVADTYNSKIKLIDPDKKTCVTYLGGPESKLFNEPGGLSIADNKIYVADTNNHRIRVVDLGTKQVTTLALEGVEPVQRDVARSGAEK
jgi:DNA-binding beta-propeller fold protein YncE/cytochrome oxidase Cu insertion factor (SCO1/SenC/PrrC family)